MKFLLMVECNLHEMYEDRPTNSDGNPKTEAWVYLKSYLKFEINKLGFNLLLREAPGVHVKKDPIIYLLKSIHNGFNFWY